MVWQARNEALHHGHKDFGESLVNFEKFVDDFVDVVLFKGEGCFLPSSNSFMVERDHLLISINTIVKDYGVVAALVLTNRLGFVVGLGYDFIPLYFQRYED